MPVGSLDAVTDITIWGRVVGDDVTEPVMLRVEVDGRLWRYARASHVDPDGGPWRFAIAHALAEGQSVSVYAIGPGQEAVLLAGSPRRTPASTPARRAGGGHGHAHHRLGGRRGLRRPDHRRDPPRWPVLASGHRRRATSRPG
jgi:hypothetical protein